MNQKNDSVFLSNTSLVGLVSIKDSILIYKYQTWYLYIIFGYDWSEILIEIFITIIKGLFGDDDHDNFMN